LQKRKSALKKRGRGGKAFKKKLKIVEGIVSERASSRVARKRAIARRKKHLGANGGHHLRGGAMGNG